jgi:DNA-directed RNA polymerase specialized sigma24 family protein
MKTDAENLTALNDVQLIEKFQQDNNRAFDVLMIRYTAHVKKCIRAKVHDSDQQKDVFQDTWLKVYTELKNNRYEENGQFENWLITIAHHHAIQFIRDEVHFIHGDDAIADEPFSVQEEGLDDTDKKVLAIIKGMKPTMRKVNNTVCAATDEMQRNS